MSHRAGELTHADGSLAALPVRARADRDQLGEGGMSVVCEVPVPGVLVAWLAGEMDASSASPAEAELRRALRRTRPRRLVLDLTDVTLLTSRGMTLLLRLRQLGRSNGFHVVLAGGSQRRVRRPLAITGLLPLFDVCPDVAHGVGPGR